MAKWLVGVVLVSWSLGACAGGSRQAGPSTATPSLSAGPRPTTAAGVVSIPCPSSPTQNSTPKGGATGSRAEGKLSSRLQRLSQPEVAQLSAEEQAKSLSLPVQGPGSLMRNQAGQILVYARVADTSEGAVGLLTEAGATVVHVAKDYCTVTVYVDPDKLTTLAALSEVITLQEALAP